MDGGVLAEKSNNANDEYASGHTRKGNETVRPKRGRNQMAPEGWARKAHRNLDRVKRDLFSKRQTQLEELAEALADENDNTKEMQLKALRNKEKMAADYKAVKSALNSVNDKRRGGGLTRLKISEHGGTRTITEPEEMAETLRDYAVKHYGQENHTIFGHGEGHDLLTDDPMSNPVYDSFLDGTFMDTTHLPNRTDGQTFSSIT